MSLQDLSNDEGIINQLAVQFSSMNLSKGQRIALGAVLGLTSGAIVFYMVAKDAFIKK
jgi:hypothetical protein